MKRWLSVTGALLAVIAWLGGADPSSVVPVSAQQPGADAPLAGELLEPGRPDLDERELRRDEERVRQDHHQCEEQRNRRMHGRGGSHNSP